MDSYIQIIVGSVIAIISASIGWFLNQAESYWNDKKDRNKKLKSLLSHLLEIYQLMIKSDIARFTDKVANKVFKKMKDTTFNTEDKKQVKAFYEQFATTLFSPMLESDLGKIKDGYEQSVKDLSEIDPIRAYWLRGRDEIFERLGSMNEFVDEAKSQFPTEFEQMGNHVDSVISSTKKKLLQELIADMENEILEIADLIGSKQRIDVNDTLLRIKTNQDKAVDKMIRDLFSKLEKPTQQ